MCFHILCTYGRTGLCLCHAEQPIKRRRMALRSPTCVVLDIEGTIAPITFVTQTLFPYAKTHVRSFLESTYESCATQEAIKLLAQQASQV